MTRERFERMCFGEQPKPKLSWPEPYWPSYGKWPVRHVGREELIALYPDVRARRRRDLTGPQGQEKP